MIFVAVKLKIFKKKKIATFFSKHKLCILVRTAYGHLICEICTKYTKINEIQCLFFSNTFLFSLLVRAACPQEARGECVFYLS